MECRRRAVLSLAGLLLLMPAQPLRAEIYQWRDADGKLHFSDRKPKHTEVEEVSERTAITNIDESAEQREALGRLFKSETPEEQRLRRQQELQQSRRQQQRQQQCAAARQQLRVLQGPVYFRRQDGSRYTISERERQQRALEFEAQIGRYCDS